MNHPPCSQPGRPCRSGAAKTVSYLTVPAVFFRYRWVHRGAIREWDHRVPTRPVGNAPGRGRVLTVFWGTTRARGRSGSAAGSLQRLDPDGWLMRLSSRADITSNKNRDAPESPSRTRRGPKRWRTPPHYDASGVRGVSYFLLTGAFEMGGTFSCHGLPTIWLVLSTKAALHLFVDENHPGRGVRDRLVDMRKHPRPLPASIQKWSGIAGWKGSNVYIWPNVGPTLLRASAAGACWPSPR